MPKLRVWHIPNPPNKGFRIEAQNLIEAKLVITALCDYDNYLGDELIFANVSGLEVLKDGLEDTEDNWGEWYDPETDQDVMDILREEWSA